MELRKDNMKGQMKEETELTVKKNWRRQIGEGRTWKETDTEGKRRARSNTRTVQRLVCTLHAGERPHPSPRRSVEKAHHCHELDLHDNEVCCEYSNNIRKSITCIEVK